MTLYLEAETRDNTVSIEAIYFVLNNGKEVMMTWDESDISRMNYYFPFKYDAFPETIIDTYNFGEFQFDDFFEHEIRDHFSNSTHYIFIVNSECSFDYLKEFTDFIISYCKINHLPIDSFDVLIKTITGEYICGMSMMKNVKNNCKIM